MVLRQYSLQLQGASGHHMHVYAAKAAYLHG